MPQGARHFKTSRDSTVKKDSDLRILMRWHITTDEFTCYYYDNRQQLPEILMYSPLKESLSGEQDTDTQTIN